MHSRSFWGAALVVLGSIGASRDASANEIGACIAAAESAQVQRDLGKYANARRELLVCSHDSCPAPIRSDCSRWLAEVERSTPTIVLTARDAKGHDAVSVRVVVDGVVFAERLDGKPVAIDPGEHLFRYEVAGRAHMEEKVLISAGERNRLVHIRLGDPVPVAVAGAPPGPPHESFTIAPDRGTNGKHTVGLVVAGVGVVAVGVGAFFGVQALSKNGDAKALCSAGATSCTNPEAESLSRDAVTSAQVANAVIGAGLLTLGVGAYLILTSPSTRTAPKPAAMRLTPLVGRELGGAVLGGAW